MAAERVAAGEGKRCDHLSASCFSLKNLAHHFLVLSFSCLGGCMVTGKIEPWSAENGLFRAL